MARPGRQLELDLRRERRGGKRSGAGRKAPPRPRPLAPHRRRPAHTRSEPLHVTMRAAVRGLRAQRLVERIVAAISATTRTRSGEFRVLEFSVQDDHVHLLAEANDARALGCGVRALAIRIARTVNGALGRRGRLWADRYHARALTTPRAVRNALVYVLANHRKHGASVAGIDPCSSGAWFRGWRDELRTAYALDDVRRWRHVPAPTAPARTWLASTGWTRHGLLATDERPLAARA